MTAARFPVVPTVTGGWRLVLRRWRDWLLLSGLLQAVVVLLAAPVLAGVGAAAIRSSGAASLTIATLPAVVAAPWAGALLAVVALVATAAIAAQTITLLTAARLQREDPDQLVPGPRALAAALGARLRSLLRPSSLLLVPYLLLIAPLGHVALGSALTTWIAIPNFIGGELMKSTGTGIAYTAALAAIWYLNLRLVLVLPMLVAGERSVPRAFAASWRATGWLPWRIVAVVLVRLALQGLAIGLAFVVVALGPILVADALAPDAAVVVAAVACGVGSVLVFLAVALIAAAEQHMLLAASAGDALPGPAARRAPDPRVGSRQRRIVGAVAAAALVAGAGGVALTWVPTFDRIDDGATLVIAHRGDQTEAVENTIKALEDAAAAGADLVEFDVQQTADGDWVVMHDFELTRLTGSPGAVADMTLEEATALTVRANGFEGPVPSMREWVRRAVELQQPLLIEIKPHGGETEDYLERFFAILDEEGAMPISLFHSLSEDVVEGQKALRPETIVGEILAINVGGTPDTAADFIVVEDWSYTGGLRADTAARDLGLLVWTIDDPERMRWYVREGVDGIITDQPATGLQERGSVADEQGLVPRLLDALSRLSTAY